MWRQYLKLAQGYTAKNIYGHLFAWDRAAILAAMDQAVSPLYADEKPDGKAEEIGV
jgi:hypothetical protein